MCVMSDVCVVPADKLRRSGRITSALKKEKKREKNVKKTLYHDRVLLLIQELDVISFVLVQINLFYYHLKKRNS